MRGYFIPWKSPPPLARQIKPRVLLDTNQMQNNHFDYPARRTSTVRFYLSGEMSKLYQGLMSSPQLMTALGAQIIAECDQVGLVEFAHWWEGFVPVGYFPDNTAQTFTWVELDDKSSTQKWIETSRGSTVLFRWGYYFSP